MYHRAVNKLVTGDNDNDDQPLLIWTDYSGIGGAELATLEVLGAIQARAPEGQQPRVQFHRSREIQEDCRKVLLAEMPPSGPCHVFGDIFECVPASARCKLEKSKRAMERKFNKTAAEGKPPQQIVRDLGESFCADLGTIIKSVHLCPGRQQFCYRCQKNCPVAWPHGKRSAGQRALAIAGVTCVDYSSFGKRRAMTGDSILCQAAWVMQMMADQPDLIIVECVVMFMLRTLKVLEDMYEIASLPFSPVDLGVPSSRPRRYTLLRHRVKTRGFMDLAHDFSNIFFRSLRVDCSVYLTAGEREIKREQRERRLRVLVPSGKKRAVAHPLSKSRLGGRVLTTSQVKRLRRWLEVARKRGLPHDFANISQNVDFMLGGKVKKQKGKNTKATLPLKKLSRLAVAPSLMRSTVLYSVSAARAIIGARDPDTHHQQQQHGNTPFIFRFAISCPLPWSKGWPLYC